MTDNDVIKLVEHFRNLETDITGMIQTMHQAINLINRLQAENERLNLILNSYALQYGTVIDQGNKIAELKSEARKEFAERLKNATVPVVLGGKYHYDVITKEGIDNLLKELDGKENGGEMQ